AVGEPRIADRRGAAARPGRRGRDRDGLRERRGVALGGRGVELAGVGGGGAGAAGPAGETAAGRRRRGDRDRVADVCEAARHAGAAGDRVGVGAVIRTVFAKAAVSVSFEAAANVQGLVVAVQVPPDQPVRRLPDAAVAVIVIESPTFARQLVTPVQPALALASVIVALPLPPPAVAVAMVTVLEKFAVSVSAPEAVKVHGLAVALQLPPDQLARRLPDAAVGVMVIESPTSTRQLAAAVQPASGLESVIVALPLPVVAAAIVTVFAKFAVSVSPEAALNLQGLVVAVQVPPDQPVRRLPDAAVAVIAIASPTSATQFVTAVQPASGLESVIVAVPLPLTAVASVTVLAKFAVS